MSTTSSAQITVRRDIAADPTSTALLLAGPTAMDLWPGLRRIGDLDGRVHAEVKVSRDTHETQITAAPPRRLPTSFITTFTASSMTDEDEEVSGTITLSFAERDGEMATQAALDLSASKRYEKAVRKLAERFLENLGEAAERRARAA